jgi:hypothetical protein
MILVGTKDYSPELEESTDTIGKESFCGSIE